MTAGDGEILKTLALASVLALASALPASAQEPPQEPAVRRVVARALKGLKADVAALVMNGREGGSLWAAMLAAPDPGGEAPGIGLWIELDGSRLLGIDGDAASTGETGTELRESVRIEVHAYAMTPSGSLAGSIGQSFRLVTAELGDALSEGGVKFFGRVAAPPGEYELRVLVRDAASGRFALRKLAVTVPAHQDAVAGLSQPFFPDVEGAWIEVREGATPAPARMPSALPVLSTGREITAHLEIHGDAEGKPRILLRVLDARQQPIQGVDVVLSEETPQPPLRRFAMRFELPDDLLTGNYFLETSYYAGNAQASTTIRTTQVYVLGLEREEQAVVWTDVSRLASISERRREALDLASKRRASKRIAAISEAYRGVLDRLVGGSVNEAVEELGRLEAEVLETPEGDAETWLKNGQERICQQVAAVDAEGLVPLLLLHIERHERYLSEGQRRLTFHARERVAAIARRYVSRSPSERAASFAAAALADMGAALRGAGMRVASRRMFDEALDLDSQNTVALIGLAIDHERRGEYAEATEYLERLLEIDPRSDEGRLRLALSLRRRGETREAARLLRRVVDQGESGWLLTLAYQELARILLRGDRTGDAVRLLEAGVRRFPDESRLNVQLAYALDRLGDGGRAREILRSARSNAGGDASPRLQYGRHLGDASGRRDKLVSQSMARLAILSQALLRSEETR